MNKIKPIKVQIETVAGYCNLKCIMCPLEKSIRKEIMSMEIYEKIISKLECIKDDIKIFTLLGLGETLLDVKTAEKIWLAKQCGFKEVGIFTNGMLLTHDITNSLLRSGLDVLICSIDGFLRETQESIRLGSDLLRITDNIEYFIKERSYYEHPAKIIIRFTRQEKNKDEWEPFLKDWKNKLTNPGDGIFCYDEHNAGGSLEHEILKINVLECSEIYERLIIFSDGRIGLCCGDQFCHHDLGNILNSDPVELYNGEIFKHYREEMKRGNIANLDLCSRCTVARSLAHKTNIFI